MAKAAVAAAAKKPESKGVATRPAGSVAELDPALKELYKKDAGRGVSTAMEDNVVPLIYILQALSPQVQKKKEEYVEGAEPGYIWFRGTKKVVGEEGIAVVPCYYSKVWIEWMPNRGGFVARHDERPD